MERANFHAFSKKTDEKTDRECDGGFQFGNDRTWVTGQTSIMQDATTSEDEGLVDALEDLATDNDDSSGEEEGEEDGEEFVEAADDDDEAEGDDPDPSTSEGKEWLQHGNRLCHHTEFNILQEAYILFFARFFKLPLSAQFLTTFLLY